MGLLSFNFSIPLVVLFYVAQKDSRELSICLLSYPNPC
jgi:hypothetical protein